MKPDDLKRYNTLYEQHLTSLKLQGKRPATIDAYSRAVRRKAFDNKENGIDENRGDVTTKETKKS